MSDAASAPSKEAPPALFAPISPTADATANRFTLPPTYVATTAPAIWAAVLRGRANAHPSAPRMVAALKEATTPATEPTAPIKNDSPTLPIGPIETRGDEPAAADSCWDASEPIR